MSLPDKIINQIDKLNDKDRQKVLEKIKEKYMDDEIIRLNESYSWWDNEEDDLYNEQ